VLLEFLDFPHVATFVDPHDDLLKEKDEEEAGSDNEISDGVGDIVWIEQIDTQYLTNLYEYISVYLT